MSGRGGFFSPAPWAATLYLLSYPVLGTVFFALVLVSVLLSAVLSIVWIGLPLLVAAAGVARGCAEIERWRVRLVAAPVPITYRAVTERGLVAQVRTRWSDPATLRDCGYLVLMYIPLMILDLVVVAVWLAFLGMVTLPFWYWSIPYSGADGSTTHGVPLGYTPNGHTTFTDGGFGIFIGDLPAALIAAAVFFVLALLGASVVVGAARLHARVVRSLLGPRVDPLHEAKRVLVEPGPLVR